LEKGIVFMNAIRRSYLTVFLGLGVLAGLITAQDITKGSISGVVRDSSGAAVAGTRAHLSSPNGDRDTMTDSGGVYLFDNLIPGEQYTVSVAQAGFSESKTENIAVRVNKRSTVDLTLQVGTTSEAITVEAMAEAIDMSSTSIGANLDESLYKNVPVGRNISAVMAMAPGVADSGGAGAANPSINGASGLENEYIVEGANTTDPGFGGFGTYSRVYGPLP
jgi:carboxypeptidase family protein